MTNPQSTLEAVVWVAIDVAKDRGWCVPFVGKPPLRSRKTPSASGRTRLAGVPVRHTDPRSALLPPNAASEWQPSLPACSASVTSSCVRSVILTDERFLHFQMRQNTDAVR